MWATLYNHSACGCLENVPKYYDDKDDDDDNDNNNNNNNTRKDV